VDLGRYENWWTFVTDRKFFLKVYQKVGTYLLEKEDPAVLDIGTKDYNAVCKQLIANNSVEYWQLEPYRQYHENNDGFYHCTVQECLSKYPESESKFNIIIDVGVFGWNGVRLSQEQQSLYIENILKMLKPEGKYILHADRIEEDPEYVIDHEKTILPFFKECDFMGYNGREYIQCDKHGTEWDVWFLEKK